MPLITLTTDIGQHDFIVGAIKGQIYQYNASAAIVDISHLLSAYNFPLAAYICRNAINNFPTGTFHLILVNVFDEKPEHIIMAQHNGQYIACADNGLLTMILEELPQKVVAIPLEKTQQKSILYISNVFAKAVAEIGNGKLLQEVGDATVSIHVKNALRPQLGTNWIEGQIIFIDHFENVVVNITKDEFEAQRKGRSFKIVFKRDEVIEKISDSYADVNEGEKLAIFNAAGYLEIAINKGNAAGLFGLERFNDKQDSSQNQYQHKQLFYQMIKVYFE
jgi:S-adenosyl-L-methionine hydrolase (adenosine-forming)